MYIIQEVFYKTVVLFCDITQSITNFKLNFQYILKRFSCIYDDMKFTIHNMTHVQDVVHPRFSSVW